MKSLYGLWLYLAFLFLLMTGVAAAAEYAMRRAVPFLTFAPGTSGPSRVELALQKSGTTPRAVKQAAYVPSLPQTSELSLARLAVALDESEDATLPSLPRRLVKPRPSQSPLSFTLHSSARPKTKRTKSRPTTATPHDYVLRNLANITSLPRG